MRLTHAGIAMVCAGFSTYLEFEKWFQKGMSDMAKGFFRSVMDAMIAARQQQAARYVNQVRRMLEDDADRLAKRK